MAVYNMIFSPTGGTKKVAELFATAFTDTYITIDLTDWKKDYSTYCFEEEDICIVSVPSFAGRVPLTAVERLEKMHGNKAKAIFIAVYGNREYEDTLVEMQDVLSEAGFIPAAAVAALAEHSIIRTFAEGRPDKNDEQVLADFAKQIKEKINESGSIEELNLPGDRPYRARAPLASKPLLKDSCVKCGLCVKACPVQAIPTDLSKSMDEEVCISCMRCETVCPIKAREVAPQVTAFLNEMLSVSAKGYKENQLFL